MILFLKNLAIIVHATLFLMLLTYISIAIALWDINIFNFNSGVVVFRGLAIFIFLHLSVNCISNPPYKK